MSANFDTALPNRICEAKRHALATNDFGQTTLNLEIRVNNQRMGHQDPFGECVAGLPVGTSVQLEARHDRSATPCWSVTKLTFELSAARNDSCSSALRATDGDPLWA